MNAFFNRPPPPPWHRCSRPPPPPVADLSDFLVGAMPSTAGKAAGKAAGKKPKSDNGTVTTPRRKKKVKIPPAVLKLLPALCTDLVRCSGALGVVENSQSTLALSAALLATEDKIRAYIKYHS